MEQKRLVGESSALMGEILNRVFADGGDKRSETLVELNLALLKIKHTLQRDTSKLARRNIRKLFS